MIEWEKSKHKANEVTATAIGVTFATAYTFYGHPTVPAVVTLGLIVWAIVLRRREHREYSVWAKDVDYMLQNIERQRASSERLHELLKPESEGLQRLLHERTNSAAEPFVYRGSDSERIAKIKEDITLKYLDELEGVSVRP